MQELMANYRPLFPGEKIEALFMFQAGTVWASWDSVYKSCKDDDRFDVRLVFITEMTVETSHMAGAEGFLKEKGIEYELYENIDFTTYCPHVVFIQFPYDAAFHTPDTLSLQFRKRGSRVVYIPYGIEISDTQISIKDHFYSFVVENAWRVYTSSEGLKAEYDKYCHNRKAIRVTGSPKFDVIKNKEELPISKVIVKKANNRKIVVWKMHFPKKICENGKIYQITPYIKEYIDFAKKIDDYEDLFFVVMAHPKMLRGVVASDTQGDDMLMQQVRELLTIVADKENVYIDSADDYRNTLYHADAIIMDRSAVMIEAAMLNVPVLFMKNKDYSEKMTIPVDAVVQSFEQGNLCMDMERFISGIRSNIDKNSQVRNVAVKNNFPFMDGKCGDRIKEDIIIGINEPVAVPKVVLYGIGEICKYYMKEQKWGLNDEFNVIAVADSDENKWGGEFYGKKIIAPKDLKGLDYDAIVIMTEPHFFEIKKSLVYDLLLDERQIWRIDDFVVEIQG